MINTNVQEVCCNQCSGKKVVDIPDDINREHRIPEGWIMIPSSALFIGTREKGENIVSEMWKDSLHFCSVSCLTNYFSKLYETVREKCKITNGHPIATVVDPSYHQAERELTTKVFFDKVQ